MDHDLAAPGLKCKRDKPCRPVPSAYRSAPRSRGNPFLPAYAGQKFFPPGGCGSLLLLRPSQRACKRQTAAPAPLRLFRPLDAPQLRSPWGQNLVLNRALAARRLAHSQRQISLYVSRPSAHVGWTGLFCRSQTRYWRKKDSILSKWSKSRGGPFPGRKGRRPAP